MLSSSTQRGKTCWVHLCSPAETSSTSAAAYPAQATQRGNAATRRPRVLTERVNTAAIRMAYTEISDWVTSRPKSQMSVPDCGPSTRVTSVAVFAAPTNIMATKRRPLPRKTVENNRSSTAPI